jgi:hypothetical protein
MDPREQSFGSFFRELRIELTGYVEARVELARLSAYEKAAHFTSKTLIFLVIGALITLIVLFISIAAGIYIGKMLNEPWAGFACVAGFYLFVLLLAFLFRKQIIGMIHTSTLEIMMQTEEDKKDPHGST